MKRTNLPKMLMKEERKMQHICGANRFKQNSKVSEINYSEIKMSDYPSKTGLVSRKLRHVTLGGSSDAANTSRFTCDICF